MKNKEKLLRKGIMILTLLVAAANTFAANGLPFYDKLEFGITIVKVVGGVIALISFIVGIYMHKQGRSESLMTCIWFCGAGLVTANVEWLAEKFGFLQGVLF
ncbi:MAG: hypothetical protein SOV59_08400 [Fusobacterium mortiferum]|nr:hypothetical protein [Fusobacterium mortiferum]